MMKSIRKIFLSMSLMASAASAQSNPAPKIFFGFDFVLQPIAIKWACGGQRDQDIAAIEALIAAYPEEAESAELYTHIDALKQVSDREGSLSELLGAEISSVQTDALCTAAKPLSIVWMTPEQLVRDDESSIPSEQRAAWGEFWSVIESLQ